MSERPLNIQHMTEPTPEKPRRGFDVERDITPEQWAQMASECSDVTNTQNWGYFVLRSLRDRQPLKITEDERRAILMRREEILDVLEDLDSMWDELAPAYIMEMLTSGKSTNVSAADREDILDAVNDSTWYDRAALYVFLSLISEKPEELENADYIAPEWISADAQAGNWINFAQLSALRAFSEAKQVHLSRDGVISLTFDDDTQPPTEPPPLPSQRNF